MEFVGQFATGYAFSANELFTRFKLDYIQISTKKHFKGATKKVVAARVFIYAYYLILKDIIDNSITFVLPTAFESYLEMQRVSGEEFVKARQNGAFQEINFLASNFSGNAIKYRFKTKMGWKNKPVCVHKKLKNIIIENTNNGKQYY
jgi:hypothetical protein